MTALQQILKDRGISQIELAKRIGVSDAVVSKWAKWGFSIPKKHLAKISKILSCEVTDLQGRY